MVTSNLARQYKTHPQVKSSARLRWLPGVQPRVVCTMELVHAQSLRGLRSAISSEQIVFDDVTSVERVVIMRPGWPAYPPSAQLAFSEWSRPNAD